MGALYNGDNDSDEDDFIDQPGPPSHRRKESSVQPIFHPHADSFSTVASRESISSALGRLMFPTPATLEEHPLEMHSSDLFPGIAETLERPTEPLTFYVDPPLLPLKSALEAQLLQHFVVHLAPTFDLGDHEQTFATSLPQQAAICPPLFRAIIRLAEQDLMRRSHSALSPLMGKAHHHDDLSGLHLLLQTLAVDTDENLLAAMVLVLHRMIVQKPTDESLVGELHSPTNLGLIWSRLLSVGSAADTIRHAVFWAFVREEIYVSILYQRRPTCFIDQSPGRLEVESGLDPADDYTWANRITWHLLVVLEYCFGEHKDPVTHGRLVDYAEAWMQARPTSFTPMFMQDKRPGTAECYFPEIICLGDLAVLGLQYYHLVRILLIAYDPGIPRVGFDQRAAARAMDHAMRSDVGIVCGIAESLDSTNPAHLAACQAVALAGDRFEDEGELKTLLEILTKTEDKFGWTTWPA